ncbi:cytosolic endo-beta-N-acetylglucosaminidase isoform X2 [Nomia melanderi]|uniref:cytosolic endo-beta-N-acetylglucosaminidase isoform X2 n=1 Tax=Nomia melanderi TaxID=2448451 RepID=UPI003FCD154C
MIDDTVIESQPFKGLQELYDNVDNLKPWPQIKELRECTDYVYHGLDISNQNVHLTKFDRGEKPKTLLCHDMLGGYIDDRFINGTDSHKSYLFYHWSVIDIFVYFSHHFITIPPFGWINAAHEHGVKILGTVITEREGILEPVLESQETARKFAEALIHVAKFYKFEGWLLNIENKIKREHINNLIYFLEYLTQRIHIEIRGSEIIWYDSVTKEGNLNWQNELNDKNIDFFLSCDGIYLNYTWTKSKLENSCNLARNHNRSIHDVYVGLDVWGRGCPGGGGFNSLYALQQIREQGLSVAIFASGWTHEFFRASAFHELENAFWAQLFPYLYVHIFIYENETFKTSFCHGNGSAYYRCGEMQLEKLVIRGKTVFVQKPFYNLSMQKPQISVPIPHLKFIRSPELLESNTANKEKKSPQTPREYIYETAINTIRILGNTVNIENKLPVLGLNYFEFHDGLSFEGGGCLKLITNDPGLYHRLYLIHVEFQQDIEATIIYNEIVPVSENGAQSKPILILGNNTGLRSILRYKSKNLYSTWKKCVYLTNMRTVNEIGVSFAGKCICYLGEIILNAKRQNRLDRWDSTDCVNRITEYAV